MLSPHHVEDQKESGQRVMYFDIRTKEQSAPVCRKTNKWDRRPARMKGNS